jgi:hypothetical protein
VPEPSRAYAVRDAGTPRRLGKVYKLYPYTLVALLEALEEARFRSFSGPPQVVTRIEGRRSTVIRRYEHGREVPITRITPPKADPG